jgi:hypothetical protein
LVSVDPVIKEEEEENDVQSEHREELSDRTINCGPISLSLRRNSSQRNSSQK